MEKGKLIVIEGISSSGKSTQSEKLLYNLKKMGIKSTRFSFPAYDTPTGKVVQKYLEKEIFPEGSINVDPKIACLYFAADRKYNIDRINKFINEGYYVIVDRYTTSNLAVQGSKIIDQDERFNMYQWIDKLEYWLLGLPKPDITIYLHVPYQKAIEMKLKRDGKDAYIDEKHLKQSEETYLELKGLYNWKMVECTNKEELKTIDEINKEIMNIILL